MKCDTHVCFTEHPIAEIRCRALDTITKKLRDATHPHLNDLTVNLDELVNSLMKWFRLEPLTNEQRVLTILLILLKVIHAIGMRQQPTNCPIELNFQSKYRGEAKQLLGNKKYRIELRRLHSELSEIAPARQILNEILDILNSNEIIEPGESKRLDAFSGRETNRTNGNAETLTDGRAHHFAFTNAWELPQLSDVNSLKLLKTSLQEDVDRLNHEHALQYFDVIVNDYPGEFFLQSPYIFAVRNLIFGMQTERRNSI